jgi:hypothetical protein
VLRQRSGILRRRLFNNGKLFRNNSQGGMNETTNPRFIHVVLLWPEAGLFSHGTRSHCHGCLKKYLWSRGRAQSPASFHCPAEVDDVEQTLFVYMYWNYKRRELVLSLDVTDLLYGLVATTGSITQEEDSCYCL